MLTDVTNFESKKDISTHLGAYKLNGLKVNWESNKITFTEDLGNEIDVPFNKFEDDKLKSGKLE